MRGFHSTHLLSQWRLGIPEEARKPPFKSFQFGGTLRIQQWKNKTATMAVWVSEQNPSWVQRERLTQKDGDFLDLGGKKKEEKEEWVREVYRERNYRDGVNL
jgi:hypothetical protein